MKLGHEGGSMRNEGQVKRGEMTGGRVEKVRGYRGSEGKLWGRGNKGGVEQGRGQSVSWGIEERGELEEEEVGRAMGKVRGGVIGKFRGSRGGGGLNEIINGTLFYRRTVPNLTTFSLVKIFLMKRTNLDILRLVESEVRVAAQTNCECIKIRPPRSRKPDLNFFGVD